MEYLCKKNVFLYFEKYVEKDIQSVLKLFVDDILFCDWKIKVKGKDGVINEIKKNFFFVDML